MKNKEEKEIGSCVCVCWERKKLTVLEGAFHRTRHLKLKLMCFIGDKILGKSEQGTGVVRQERGENRCKNAFRGSHHLASSATDLCISQD